MTEKTTKKTKELNIYQKLVDVRRDVQYLQKEKAGHTYKYVEEHQILALIRPKMDEHNIILEMDMIGMDQFDFQKTVRGQVMNAKGIRATFQFIWINGDNPEEKITKTMILQNDGIDCKAIGALMTYANRYFLLKYFNVPIAELEPDSYQERLQSEVPAVVVTNITEDQIQSLEILINGHDEIRSVVLSRCGGDISNIKHSEYSNAVQWVKNEIARLEASNA